MDTDDDVSALEEEEEEVALLCHSSLTYELELSHSPHHNNPEASCSSPCLSDLSCPPTHSLTNSKEDIISSESEEDGAPSLGHRRGPYPFPVDRPERNHTVVRYVIHSARTQLAKEEKFVVYRVGVQQLVEGEEGVRYKPLQKQCAVFERRYSEFLAVYTALMDSHRSLMEEFEGFPKKVLIGNFSQEVIIERCKGLTRFLNFVHKEGVLSRTAVFSKFLYHPEVKASNNFLLQSQFEEACPILENTFVLLDSLQWDTGLILRTLCQLVVCLYAVGSYEQSHAYAKVALAKFQSPTNRKIGKELYLPLLVFCDNLWGVLGKDKRAIRGKLEAARKHRRQDDVTPNLLDKLRDDIALRTLH